jgi:hypothetical protein
LQFAEKIKAKRDGALQEKKDEIGKRRKAAGREK